jgi:hypothetical protein
MLEARKVSLWHNRYELVVDGLPITLWEGRVWRSGGTFELAGRRYDVAANFLGSRFEMADDDGATVAAAERVGRKRWSVDAGGRIYRFQRTSWWRQEELLLADDRPVGSIRRTSSWRSGVVAELPDVPLVIQVFVVAVVLNMWDSQAADASGA